MKHKSTVLAIALSFCFITETPAQEDLRLVDAFPNLRFSQPVYITHSKDGTDRLFVVEQRGIIRVFANDANVSSAEIFLDIDSRVTSGGEMGLLGLAFHPDYEDNGFFYVNYTTGSGSQRRTHISRFSTDPSDPNRADPNSELVLLAYSQPFGNHNGGMIEFGDDGFLYIAVGDGGSAADPLNSGQDRSSLLGSILRIDVDNSDLNLNYAIPDDNPFVGESNVRTEIWAYGLRNPWRLSFDSTTGMLWAGDVGQNRREEIDIIESGGNYGWRIMEGTECFNRNNPQSPLPSCDKTGLIEPIKEYPRDQGRSITGGYVYRGKSRPEFAGAYIYGDFETGRIWLLRYENERVTQDSLLLAPRNFGLSSFGVDESDELYLVEYFAGAIYKFSPNPATSVADPAGPRQFFLQQNYPNPFNPNTRIQYEILQAGIVNLSIYNQTGQKIKTLVNGFHTRGEYDTAWDGTDEAGRPVATGIYLYRLEGINRAEVRKMIFMK